MSFCHHEGHERRRKAPISNSSKGASNYEKILQQRSDKWNSNGDKIVGKKTFKRCRSIKELFGKRRPPPTIINQVKKEKHYIMNQELLDIWRTNIKGIQGAQ